MAELRALNQAGATPEDEAAAAAADAAAARAAVGPPSAGLTGFPVGAGLGA
jgi:hypothetical protein